MDQFEGRHYTICLWALATLGLDPGSAWQKQAQRQALALATSGDLTPQGLSLSLWGVACLSSMSGNDSSVEAGAGEVQTAGQQAQQRRPLAGASGQGPQQCGPSADWMDAYLQAAVQSLNEYEPRHISVTLYACALVGHCPHPSISAALVSGAVERLEWLGPQAVANILWSVAKLSLQLEPQQMQVLLEQAREEMENMSAHQLASTAWAVATLQVSISLVMSAWVHTEGRGVRNLPV